MLMTFVLFVVLTGHLGGLAGGPNHAVTHIEGFTSEDSCKKAGEKIKRDIEAQMKGGDSKINFSCVEKK